jgi:Icc-related predicted phosphoesterase
MTHDGPRPSATTVDALTKHDRKEQIHFGSKYLYEFLDNNQGRIVANIHGHVHHGTPMDQIRNLRVINPGSLKYGEFAELRLKENADGTWRIVSYNKHFLE